ncbi:OmpA family protein [Mycobacterium sp. AMU20-3851]|uniref:channel-forming protein ArfA/OmpATb n=1 Tax=Mycobacterium sp. AMU20-3851 TaxID=3122055 RepID=UPI003754A267
MPASTDFYRRPPGAGWLAALIVVPLALALIGTAVPDDASDSALPNPVISTAPTLTQANGRPDVVMAPFSLQHSNDDVVVSGQVPDEPTRAFALDRVRTVLPGSNVVDLLTVIGGITAPDLSGIDGVLGAATPVPDFGFSINGGDVILTGTAESEDVTTRVEDAVQAAWPDLAVVNDIAVITPGFVPPQAPVGPGLTGGCAELQQDISGLLRTPIQYEADGARVAESSAPLIAQLVKKLKACPQARVSIIAHTDDSVGDAAGLAQSTRQAKAVADAFIRQGVSADRITSDGAGSAEPVAGNDTEADRAQNRRIEITVS